MGLATYLPGALALTGVAAGAAGIGDTVNPLLKSAGQALPAPAPVAAPAPAKSASPTAGNPTQATSAAPSNTALGGTLPAWVKVVGYVALGLGGLFIGSKIVKG